MVGFLEFLEGDADGAPCERARFKGVPAADCRGRCTILGVEAVVRPPRVGEGKREGLTTLSVCIQSARSGSGEVSDG